MLRRHDRDRRTASCSVKKEFQNKTADVEHFQLLTKSINQVGKWNREKNFRTIS